jgi:hypothetical protein
MMNDSTTCRRWRCLLTIEHKTKDVNSETLKAKYGGFPSIQIKPPNQEMTFELPAHLVAWQENNSCYRNENSGASSPCYLLLTWKTANTEVCLFCYLSFIMGVFCPLIVTFCCHEFDEMVDKKTTSG